MSNHAVTKTEKTFSWRETLGDLGFFSWLFSAVFGTVPIIALAQAAFITHDLSTPFQAIIDAYQQGMAAFGQLVEPHLQPIIDWLAKLFPTALAEELFSRTPGLHSYWRHLLLLSMLFFIAMARITWREEELTLANGLIVFSLTLLSLPLAFFAGLLNPQSSSMQQGFIALLPFVAPAWFLAGFVSSHDKRVAHSTMTAAGLRVEWMIVGLCAFCFILAVVLSFVPSVRAKASIIALGASVISLGVVSLVSGLKRRIRTLARIGVTILGGFIGAGLVYVLDWVIKNYD